MARECSFIKRSRVGPNTIKAQALLLVTLLAAVAIASSGCVYFQNVISNPGPTSTPVVVTITATPTATPAPTAVARQMSPDVVIMQYGDKGLVSFDSEPADDQQYESIIIVLGNDGTADAKNVVVALTETDAHGGNMLVQQNFKVGDLKRGERKDFTLVTDKHDQAASILIKADLSWGESGEYYNPMTYLDITKSVIWMMNIQP